METLITGVATGFLSVAIGVAIGLRWRKVENRGLRAERDDAWMRIDASTTIKPEPKR